jgi:hypothetical protein
MKRVMDDKSLHMEIIVNPKVSFRFDIMQEMITVFNQCR